MTMFTLEINLNTNTSTFTLSLSPRVSPSTSKSLLDVAGMQTTHQNPFLFFSFNRPAQCPFIYSPLVCFSEDRRYLRALCPISFLSSQMHPLNRPYFAKLIFYCFFCIHTCINEFSFSSIDKRSR